MMSDDGRTFAAGSKRSQPRAQREPAGGGQSSVSVMDAATPPAVSVETSTRDENGWIVSPPPFHVLLNAGLVQRATLSGTTVNAANDEMEQLKRWFEAAFEAGATAGELTRMRSSWQPHHVQAKWWARDHFIDAIIDKAVKRDGERARATEEAEQPALALRQMDTWLAEALRLEEEARKELEKRSAVVRKRRAEREAWIEQHPHLRSGKEAA